MATRMEQPIALHMHRSTKAASSDLTYGIMEAPRQLTYSMKETTRQQTYSIEAS